MTPRLVPCHCDPAFNNGRGAMAVCPTCEHRQLEGLLALRGVVARDGHPATAALNALLDAYDHDDREWDRASEHMAGRRA